MTRPGVILWILLRSAARGLQASAVTTGVAIVTMAIALVLVGAFALFVSNMEGLLERFGEDIQVVAYLEHDLGDAERQSLADRVAAVAGVGEVELVTPEEALERFSATTGAAGLLEGLEENPLPASLEVRLDPEASTPERVDALAAQILLQQVLDQAGWDEKP